MINTIAYWIFQCLVAAGLIAVAIVSLVKKETTLAFFCTGVQLGLLGGKKPEEK